MILVAGFVSWDPNLILSAAFTPEHLGMDFFWKRFQHVECERTFVSTKWSMARWHHPNHIIKSLQEPRHKTQKHPIYAHLHNTLSQCWGMDGHVLRSTSHEAILRIAVKHLWLTFIPICLAPKKIRFHSTVSYAMSFFCFTLFLPFQQNIANVVITPWPWCPTCKECQKSHHFFQLQRLVRSKCISRRYSNLGNRVAFAQKYSTSTHRAWQHLPRVWGSNQKS